MTAFSADHIQEADRVGDIAALGGGEGHFATAGRDGRTVRLARTLGAPPRYFVAKMFHEPFLIAPDRIDSIFEWRQAEKIGRQFDPSTPRWSPRTILVEIDQIGCPDPAPVAAASSMRPSRRDRTIFRRWALPMWAAQRAPLSDG